MKANIFFILKFLFFALIIISIMIFIIYFFSQYLLIDKESKINIDEGLYILNKMSYDYEQLLKEKEKLLQSEREKLLSNINESKSNQEKLEIERKLREIELQRKQLNQEFEDTKKEKKDIEENLKNIRETSNITNDQYNELNKRYQELLFEKEDTKKYWQDYIASIKNILIEHYKFNLKKKEEVEESFNNNNGIDILTKEYGSFYSVIADKDKQIKELTKNTTKDINDLKKEITNLEKKIMSLESNVDLSESDSEYYKNFYKEYSQTIKDFNNILEHYNNANEMIKNKKESNAKDEFKKAIDVFNELKISFQKINEIEKKIQNANAVILYEKANINIKNKKYEQAYEQLSNLISQNPLSDYVDKALSDLLKISNSMGDQERVEIANRYAQQMLNNAETLERQKKYDDAINICYKLIKEYPYSIYITDAIDLTVKINDQKTKNNLEIYNNDLKTKFLDDYKKYLEYSTKQDYEKARKYYFTALYNSFNYLTDDTINNFKALDDKYIELMMKHIRDEQK